MSDSIKEAFTKVKQDIFNLQSQISSLQREIHEIKRTLIQTDTPDRQTDRQITQTDKHHLEAFKPQDLPISIGNQGVQTDRQTIRQTDRHVQKFTLSTQEDIKIDKITQIEKVSEVLESLDTLKKELRAQFKKLTPQEMLVFSTLYQLEEEGLAVDYSLLASKTKLSESSIRDYIQKLVSKEIPVLKTKENNKRVTLTIPLEFKKMASLSTIISLRGLQSP